MGPPPQAAAPPQRPPFPQSLKDLIQMATSLHEDAPDEQSRAQVLGAATQLAKLLAGYEKDKEKAMGMGPHHRVMRRNG